MSEKMIADKNAIFSRDSDETGLNNNSLVIGSSGAGKSVSIIVPFLLHTHESSVICSLSKRRVADQFIPYYKKMGYKVIDMNFEQLEKSEMCYDPIAYLCSTEDITHLSSALVMSDNRKATSKADPYWDSTSVNLLNALISMTLIFEEDATMEDVLRNADILRIKPGCSHIETTLDDKFDLIVERDPHGFCANNWLVFSTLDSTKTASCIISSLQTMLSTIFTSGLRSQIRKKKCIDIEKIGEERTALFITTSAMNSALYTFGALFFGQIFRSLFIKAQRSPGYRLPVRVSMCYDDFAVGGVAVKNFDEYLRIEDCEFSGMPGYAYDCHTLEGKRRGKTVADFIVEEQKDLKPYQPGMFDEESWDRFLGANSRGGWDNTDKKYPQPTEAQLKELENEDFQDGAPVRYEQMDLFGGSKW